MKRDLILEGKFLIAQRYGYKGPRSHRALDTFAQSSPMMIAKFNAIGVGLAAGGYIRGYQEGGFEYDTMPKEKKSDTEIGNPSGNAAVDSILKGAVGVGTNATQDLNNDGKVSSADALLAAQNAGLTSGASDEADVSGGAKDDETSLEEYQKKQKELLEAGMKAPEKADIATVDTSVGLIDESKGKLDEYQDISADTATASTADAPDPVTAETYDAVTAAGDVSEALGASIPAETAAKTALEMAVGKVPYDKRYDIDGDGKVTSAEALQIAQGKHTVMGKGSLEAVKGDTEQYKDMVEAATMTEEDSLLMKSDEIKAQKGTSIDVNAPADREIEKGELIDLGDIAGQAEKAAKFAEQIQYAEATPSKKAMVKGQLEDLMSDFEGGKTPPWAAGAMRAANATMAARGLAASSMAGQAIIQAAMESALPIAQADAATQASFEAQNLSNRQQRMMLAAEQRAAFIGQEFDQTFQARVANAGKISDVANMNFTAEQQIAIENSRAANTMALANLSNEQAVVMAKAAALANMDLANLSNTQQAAVQNAQNFLAMDMSNLDRAQEVALFKAQSKVTAILSDKAAENAALQFNATSENQTKQFNENLAATVNQFNVAQTNAIEQFNTGQKNSMKQFNENIKNQRDQFTKANELVIAQANAVWKQNAETLDTAAENAANESYATAMNNMSQTNLDALWQAERDAMNDEFTAKEAAKDRALSVLLAEEEAEIVREKLDNAEDTAKTELGLRFLFGDASGLF